LSISGTIRHDLRRAGRGHGPGIRIRTCINPQIRYFNC